MQYLLRKLVILGSYLFFGIGLGYAQPSTIDSINLAFFNTDIEAVVSAIAKATNQTIILDPKVKGVMSLSSARPVSSVKALEALSTALRMNGYALIDANGTYRVVTDAEAKLQSTLVTGKRIGGDEVITRVFKLQQESANNLVATLKPLVSPNSSMNAYSGNNSIVITDYASNIQRIAQLIASLDTPDAGKVQSIQLKNATALETVALLTKIFDTTNTANPEPAFKIAFVAEPRSNSILIRGGTSDKLAQVRSLIANLDVPQKEKFGNIWVVPLKNADATKLAITLRAIVAADASLSAQATGQQLGVQTLPNPAMNQNPSASLNSANLANVSSGQMGSSAATSALTSSSAPSTGGIIQADPSTNSLIITASEPLFRNLKQVIEQLDKRRAQVYIEALIVELSAADAAQIGVQWQNISGTSNNAVYSGTNFNAGVGTGANVVNLSSSTNAILSGGGTATSATVAPAAGLNLGLIKSFVGGTGISALVNALESRAGTNILSTPNLMTLDNEEARIVVGQNVPIITGQFSQGTVSSTGVNPFQTVARQDIGVTLRVKPQISETGTIKLQIYQEVSSINTSLSTTTGGYVLNKRNIESNVLVDDGQMLVLGGLMQDSYTDSAFKVPYLSNIPYLGALFRSDAKTREKSNLMVFLRPKIVKDENELKNLSDSSFDSMNQRRENFEQAPKLVPKEKLPTMDEFSTIQTPSSKESSPTAVPFAVK